MNYLLVAQSLKIYTELNEYCMPMGIAYINGAMRKKGFHVDAINMLFEKDSVAALKKKIKEKNIDVLMCGGLTSEYKELKRLYVAAREANPEIIIIGGGGGFTSEPILFSEMTGVDYAVIGEGEITNCELAAALESGDDVSKIDGIVFHDNTGYHMTVPRAIIENPDTIPFPSYEGLSMDLYLEHQNVDGWYNYYTYYSDEPRMMPMLMARSCPFQCSFCFHPIGRKYRARSLDNFFEELELWIKEYNINGIALIDECFSIDKKRVLEFCHRIKPYNLKWACQMRAETYTDELLSAMKDSGCIGACFGIESMSEAVLENMNKKMKLETIENALSLTYKYRLGCTGNLIFGSEAETFETMAESLEWHRLHARKYHNRPVRHFFYVQTYPGSIFYDHAVSRGLITDKREFIESENWNLNITNMCQEDYDAMGDVICLCRLENYNIGKIIETKYLDEQTAELTTMCPYCGHTNVYRKFNRKKLNSGKIEQIGCRNCNMMIDYILKPEKYIYDEYISIPWFFDRHRIEIPADFFVSRSWKRIGIWGMNAFAKKIISCLKNIPETEVVYIYDQRIMMNIDYYGVSKYDCTDCLPQVDFIINADMTHRYETQSTIIEHTDTPAVYLETLLRFFAGKSVDEDTDSFKLASKKWDD